MIRSTRYIDELIHDLSHVSFNTPDVYNQYAPHNHDNALRCHNLKLYLNEILKRQPKYMLVMEAPGYRGCRLTGIPVTSRKILLEGAMKLDLFGKEQGYQLTQDAGFENVYGEQSATIVWTALQDLGITPLIWNTFPFHPRKGDDQCSNRTPRAEEKNIGARFLNQIADYFKPEVIIAVGNIAHDTLLRSEINCLKVRHPAQGGKNDFVEGINQIMNPTSS
ncbi:MAG: uracil-DNA glycosylase [Phototrophicaceae bacterium]